jgi:hypothetical protein
MKQPQDMPEDGPRAPERLVEALKRSRETAVFVPRTVDEFVLRTARRQLEPRRRGPRAWLVWLRWTTVGAAACALLGFALFYNYPSKRPGAAYSALQKQQVDILDAFALARKLKAGSALPQDDVNGDGRVNDADVAALAARAVRLAQRGAS